MNYSKFTDEILSKKLTKLIKEANEFVYQLGNKPDLPYVIFDEMSRQEREDYCTVLAKLSKEYKIEVDIKTVAIAEELRKEEEAERLTQKEEKRLKDENDKMRMILVDKEKFDRLKYRFFNLSVPSDEDSDGLRPESSPPFFDNKLSQFTNELLTCPYRLFYGTYESEDIGSIDEFMKINRSKCHAALIDEDYPSFLFVCLRITNDNGVHKFESFWISNLNESLEPIINGFSFVEVDTSDKSKINDFAICFSKRNKDDPTLISEIYAR